MSDGNSSIDEPGVAAGELVPVPPNGEAKAVDIYNGASTLVLSEKATEILLEPVKDENVDIRPDGLLYLPQVFVRDRLNRAFGVAQWAMMELDLGVKGKTMSYDGALIVRGKFVSRAMGQADYIEKNPKHTWPSVKESAKSDCIARCCKDLGIAKELWQPRWCEKWIKKYAVKVWRKKTKNPKTGEKGVYHWRHVDRPPFYDEGGAPSDKKQEVEPAPASDPTTYTGNKKLVHDHVMKEATEKHADYGDMMESVTSFTKKEKDEDGKDTGKTITIRGRRRIEDLSDARLDVLVKKLKLKPKKSEDGEQQEPGTAENAEASPPGEAETETDKERPKDQAGPATAEPGENPSDLISKRQAEDFSKMLKRYSVTEEKANQYLKETFGISHVWDLRKPWRKQFRDWVIEQGIKPEGATR